MRLVILLIIILFLIGCASQNKAVIFNTPLGNITKGDSMAGVMSVLGNPSDMDISYQDNSEIWYYPLPEGKEVFVYFLNKKVTEIRDQEGKSLREKTEEK